MADDVAEVVATSSTLKTLCKNLYRNLIPLQKTMDEIKIQRSALRKQFTADTGITMADFDAMARLAGIEDDDARRGKQEDIETVFNALSPGEQLNFQL